MKQKHLSLIIPLTAILLLGSCSESFLPTPQPAPETQPQNILPIRTQDEALEIAQRAISMIDVDLSQKSRSLKRHIANSSPLIIGKNLKSRSSATDTLLYIINYADSMGFAIVSASRNTPGLIAVTESGHYENNAIDNPGFNFYLNQAIDYVENSFSIESSNHLKDTLVIGGRIPMPEERVECDTIWHHNMKNRVNVFWGQKDPEGILCPNGTSGCVITALGMALTYFKTPTTLKLTYLPNAPEITLDWDKLSKHNARQSINGVIDCTESNCDENETHEMLARMMREFGHLAHTKYNNDGNSPTNIENLRSLFTLFALEYSYHSCSRNSMREELTNSNSVLLVSGTDPTINEAHMWVCDAVKSFYCKYRLYRNYSPEPLKHWVLEKEWQDDYSLTYNYFNWGWGAGKHSYCGWFVDLQYYINGNVNYNFCEKVGFYKIKRWNSY